MLTEYLDGTLGAHDRARLEAHLGVCDDCEVYLEQFRMTISITGRVQADQLSVSTREGLLRAFRAPHEHGGISDG